MPTDENVNASEQTVAQTPPAQPEITEDAVKAHPLYQELERKHSAARQGMDKANIEKKEAQKASENSVPQEDTLWLIENAADLKLVKNEFASYKAKGYSQDDALRLAKLDKGLLSGSKAENARQAATATAPATVDRSEEDVEVSETDKRFGVSKDTKKKYRSVVEG